MRKVIFTLCLLLAIFTQDIYSQDAPITTIGQIVNYGSTAIIPISVENFNAIGSCNLKIVYDPNILLASVVVKETILPGNLASNLSVPGIISLGWYTVPGVSLSDNTVIFTLVFSQIAPGYSDIQWDDNGYSCSWSDENFNYLNDTPTVDFYIEGSVDGSRYLDFTVFLEGAFETTEMRTDLNDQGLLPLSQPYNAPPWNYGGIETVGVIPNTDVVDWCLVDIRDASNAASATAATSIQKQAGFVLKEGSIVGMDGTTQIELHQFINNNLFVVVWHRNHLGVMTAVPLIFNTGVYPYDFSTAASQAYLNGQKDMGGDIYGMIAGDADGNGQILQDDMDIIWAEKAGENGYLGGDVDMDGQINNQDKNDTWLENLNEQSQIPN